MDTVTVGGHLLNAALTALDQFDLNEDRVAIRGWGTLERKVLNLCLEHNITNRFRVAARVEKRIKQIGRENFKLHLDTKVHIVWPDHLPSPHALAFAMRKGELSDREISQIRFDHGDTKWTFMGGVEETLVEKVVEQLLNEPAPQPETKPDPELCVHE